MDNANNSSIILELNKKEQIKALRDVGFTDIADDATMEEITDHMRWLGGLRDLKVATYLKASLKEDVPKKQYFTKEEWTNMSINEKSKYVAYGVGIRVEKMAFVIALQDVDNRTRFKWSSSGINIPGLKDFDTVNSGLYDDIDGEANTDLILTFAKEQQNLSCPAAEAARAYKAFTKAADSTVVDDPTKWSLPAFGQLRMYYVYREEINKFLTDIFGSSYKLTNDWYWSSTEWDAGNAWYVGVFSGSANYSIKTNMYPVRAVAAY